MAEKQLKRQITNENEKHMSRGADVASGHEKSQEILCRPHKLCAAESTIIY